MGGILEYADHLARIPGIITGKAREFITQGAGLEHVEHNAHRLMTHHVIGDDEIAPNRFHGDKVDPKSGGNGTF